MGEDPCIHMADRPLKSVSQPLISLGGELRAGGVWAEMEEIRLRKSGAHRFPVGAWTKGSGVKDER